jgi:hypothetical protein
MAAKQSCRLENAVILVCETSEERGLYDSEFENFKSQIVTSSRGGSCRADPDVFTEQVVFIIRLPT